jgi:hypothetical protein
MDRIDRLSRDTRLYCAWIHPQGEFNASLISIWIDRTMRDFESSGEDEIEARELALSDTDAAEDDLCPPSAALTSL